MPGSQSTRRTRAVRVLLALAVCLSVNTVPGDGARAQPRTANGYTTSASAPASVRRGRPITIRVGVRSDTTRSARVHIRIVREDNVRAQQRTFAARSLVAGRTSIFNLGWTVPLDAPLTTYTVIVAITRPEGGPPQHWNFNAEQFRVRPKRFGMLPPGSTLPSDAACTSQVLPQPEIRPANRTYNQTRGRANRSLEWPYSRVTGNFTGTTDEIIQWASCKWGFSEDIIRAQTAKESWWFQRSAGDFTSDPSECAPGHPIGADGRPGQCPESVGVQQVRYQYWRDAFPWAGTSTAYNLDYAMAARRSCFEGRETWLNDFSPGRRYGPGDLWGCIGTWFSGRWYTSDSVSYIADVREYLDMRIWETSGFINFTG